MALLVQLRLAFKKLLTITIKSKMLMLLLIVLILSKPAEAEVYLTKEAALELVLGKDSEIKYTPKEINKDLLLELDAKGLLAENQNKAHFFIARKNNNITGYALIDQEIGKHLPITYIIGFDPQGVVTRVEMMVFREIRGWEVREKRFMTQYEGKKLEDSLEIGKTLKNVTGATLSAKAISKGVKRGQFLWQYFFNTHKSHSQNE